ncbi:hypothetical protein FACS18949_15260 [Clostridia bacterium]|nr:hypothetical protein FACS18949_15260 [Clostridia bacterium]
MTQGEKQNCLEAYNNLRERANYAKRGDLYTGDFMKPQSGIFEKLCAFENLFEAYTLASKGKRYRDEVLAFYARLEENLLEIKGDLLSGEYTPGDYREFYIHEPKKRLVMTIPFRDRVVQWALYQVVNPLFLKGYITDSYACIEGRGVHQASARIKYWAKLLSRDGANPYYLKLDISKYYYRIDHDILLDILRKKLNDKPLIDLFEKIIKGASIPFGLPEGATVGSTERIFGKGMPIGNLSSQMFANIYLNELDQYIKRELRVRYYVRYMDDMAIFADNKEDLHRYKSAIETFLRELLNLSLNAKTAIRPLKHGIEFCGFRVWHTHIKLRKQTALRMKRRLKKVKEDFENGAMSLEMVSRTVASYKGIFDHCDSYALRRSIFGDIERGDWGGWFVLRRKSDTTEDG